jgi:vacuolar-type H+-ATPase subunit D/Vma8
MAEADAFDTIVLVPGFSMNEATSELLADANDIVREQLALAWREHIERVRDVLEAQWPERMERTLEETVAGLAARLEEEHQDALQARIQQTNRSAETTRRELIQKLNQIARRLRSFENERQWSNTLVDATRGFCGRAALFLVRDRTLHLETTRNFDDADLTDGVSLEDAPAFAATVETRDTVVAMRSASELSRSIAGYLGDGDDKVYLFPVITRQSVPAVLCTDSGEIDVDALELLAAMAGTVLSSQLAATTARTAPVDGLVNITVPATATQKPEILSWFSLSREDRELHLRAQRFARVQVAQIRLYQSEKVKNGRTAHDLYTSLKEEIGSAREAFRREFLDASDSMVDYLHLELVRTLANDDAEVLGQQYPGPMV